MYPAAPHKKLTQTVDSSYVFETLILQKQPILFNNMTISGDKNTFTDLEKICLQQVTEFFY